MHCHIVVRKYLFAEIHSCLCTDFRLRNVTTFLHIGLVAIVEPFDYWIPFGTLKFVQIFDVLQLKEEEKKLSWKMENRLRKTNTYGCMIQHCVSGQIIDQVIHNVVFHQFIWIIQSRITQCCLSNQNEK